MFEKVKNNIDLIASYLQYLYFLNCSGNDLICNENTEIVYSICEDSISFASAYIGGDISPAPILFVSKNTFRIYYKKIDENLLINYIKQIERNNKLNELI